MVTHQVTLFMFVFFLLFLVYALWQGTQKCWYCGEVNGHEDDCPHRL